MAHEVDVRFKPEILALIIGAGIDIGSKASEVGCGLDEVRVLRDAAARECVAGSDFLPVPLAVVIDFRLELAVKLACGPVLHRDPTDLDGLLAHYEFVGVVLADHHVRRVRYSKTLAGHRHRDERLTAIFAIVPPDCRIRIPYQARRASRLCDTLRIPDKWGHSDDFISLTAIPQMQFQVRDLGILGAELITKPGNHHGDKRALALERGRKNLVPRNLGVFNFFRLHQIRPGHLLHG